jgi:type II secretory pathway component PulC
MRTWVMTALFPVVLAACGGQAPPPAKLPVVVQSAAAPVGKTPTRAWPPNSLARSAVQAALEAGPGAFLQSLTVDEHPVFVAGKFHGFRITALQGESWKGVDLRPGDVVTRVNGFSIEHPEDAAEAFYSLRVASELRVEYEREGVPREIRFGIVDDVAPSSPPAQKAN